MSVDAPQAPEATAGVEEVHILWISEGMSCDGDTVSITAASQPAIEDVLLGAIPGPAQGPPAQQGALADARRRGVHEAVPRRRATGTLDAPYVARHRGLDPEREHQRRRLLDLVRQRPRDGRADHHQHVDRRPRARGAGASIAVGTCATYGGIHAMAGNPTGCMGLADYLGWDFRSAGGLPIVNVPGCPVQPDNFMETLTWLLYQAAGPRADDPARRGAAADVAVRQDGPRGLRPRGLLRAGRLRRRTTTRPSAR